MACFGACGGSADVLTEEESPTAGASPSSSCKAEQSKPELLAALSATAVAHKKLGHTTSTTASGLCAGQLPATGGQPQQLLAKVLIQEGKLQHSQPRSNLGGTSSTHLTVIATHIDRPLSAARGRSKTRARSADHAGLADEGNVSFEADTRSSAPATLSRTGMRLSPPPPSFRTPDKKCSRPRSACDEASSIATDRQHLMQPTPLPGRTQVCPRRPASGSTFQASAHAMLRHQTNLSQRSPVAGTSAGGLTGGIIMTRLASRGRSRPSSNQDYQESHDRPTASTRYSACGSLEAATKATALATVLSGGFVAGDGGAIRRTISSRCSPSDGRRSARGATSALHTTVQNLPRKSRGGVGLSPADGAPPPLTALPRGTTSSLVQLALSSLQTAQVLAVSHHDISFSAGISNIAASP